jgi:hypothetical protein
MAVGLAVCLAAETAPASPISLRSSHLSPASNLFSTQALEVRSATEQSANTLYRKPGVSVRQWASAERRANASNADDALPVFGDQNIDDSIRIANMVEALDFHGITPQQMRTYVTARTRFERPIMEESIREKIQYTVDRMAEFHHWKFDDADLTFFLINVTRRMTHPRPRLLFRYSEDNIRPMEILVLGDVEEGYIMKKRPIGSILRWQDAPSELWGRERAEHIAAQGVTGLLPAAVFEDLNVRFVRQAKHSVELSWHQKLLRVRSRADVLAEYPERAAAMGKTPGDLFVETPTHPEDRRSLADGESILFSKNRYENPVTLGEPAPGDTPMIRLTRYGKTLLVEYLSTIPPFEASWDMASTNPSVQDDWHQAYLNRTRRMRSDIEKIGDLFGIPLDDSEFHSIIVEANATGEPVQVVAQRSFEAIEMEIDAAYIDILHQPPTEQERRSIAATKRFMKGSGWTQAAQAAALVIMDSTRSVYKTLLGAGMSNAELHSILDDAAMRGRSPIEEARSRVEAVTRNAHRIFHDALLREPNEAEWKTILSETAKRATHMPITLAMKQAAEEEGRIVAWNGQLAFSQLIHMPPVDADWKTIREEAAKGRPLAEVAREMAEKILSLEGRHPIGSLMGPHGHIINNGYSLPRDRNADREHLIVDWEHDKALQDLFERIVRRLALDRIETLTSGDEEVLRSVIFEEIKKWVPQNPDKWAPYINQKVLVGVAIENGGACLHMGLIAAAILEHLEEAGTLHGQSFFVRGPNHAWAVQRSLHDVRYAMDMAQQNRPFDQVHIAAQYKVREGQHMAYKAVFEATIPEASLPPLAASHEKRTPAPAAPLDLQDLPPGGHTQAIAATASAVAALLLMVNPVGGAQAIAHDFSPGAVRASFRILKGVISPHPAPNHPNKTSA